jgi:alpha-1,3-glucosyltransferase
VNWSWSTPFTSKMSFLKDYPRPKFSSYIYFRFIQVSTAKHTAHAAALAILLSPGFLIIDHIHFQYNGFLYGILILSLVYAQNRATLLRSGLLFAGLLCFKHIYLYLAPAYFVYLLRAYCLHPKYHFRVQWTNCIKLGVGIAAIFATAFGPFAAWGQIPQLLSRLFPFSRGLCHAYWAPNVWAMYSLADRVLIYSKIPRHLPPLREANIASRTIS